MGRTHTPDSWWFVKSRRAQNPQDHETWIAGGVAPTLNAFDNATETRATVVAVTPIQDGREVEKKQNGLGIGNEGNPAYTLDTASAQAIAFNWQNGGGYGNADPGLGITEDGTGPLSASQVPAVTAAPAVRRLTPMECERLQGFPDGWTAERYDEAKQIVVEQSDSARYKQMGNAVAVPVFQWVIERLVATENALSKTEDGAA